MSSFRRYINGDPSGNIFEVNLQDINPNAREYHIVLAFATDYDDQGHYQNGIFRFNGNLQKIVEAVHRFDNVNTNLNIKLFISIGSRDPLLPFQAGDSWVSNATDSLGNIFGHFKNLGRIAIGIDVYYEHIKPEVNTVFHSYVGELIRNLKDKSLITVASIAPSFTTEKVYTDLYNEYYSYIDWVVYQFYNDTIATPRDVSERYKSRTSLFQGARLLAGYSTDRDDWRNIKPTVFYKGIIPLVKDKEAPGTSVWDFDELIRNGWSILPFGVLD